MGTQYNREVSEELMDVLRIQQARDAIPQQFLNSITPVVDINPKHAKEITIIRTVTNSTINTNGALYTPSAEEDFFLTGFDISATNGATSQATKVRLYGAMFDATLIDLGGITNVTGVASTVAFSHDFKRPLKMARGSTIYLGIQGAAVGSCLANCTIYGYYESYKS